MNATEQVNNRDVEEVESNHGYFSGYEPKPITEQVAVLRELFPELGSANESLAEVSLPEGIEGWFAIPRWKRIADTYGEAVQKVLDLIKQTRGGKLRNYCKGQFDPQHLRQHDRTATNLRLLGEAQSEHDILMVPAQFGFRHRGNSVSRARAVFEASEFGLGAFQVACMLLTHPKRLKHVDDLCTNCAGDEFVPIDGGRCSHAPFLGFTDKIEFGALWITNPQQYYGSASGFVTLP